MVYQDEDESIGIRRGEGARRDLRQKADAMLEMKRPGGEEPTVAEALDALEEMIERVTDRSRLLINRVGPVLQQEDTEAAPMAVNPGPIHATDLSPVVVQRLASLAGRLQTLGDDLHHANLRVRI